MTVPLAYTDDVGQVKTDTEDLESDEEEDSAPMTTAEVQEDKKIQKLKQLLGKNKEMTVILQKERTLRLKAEAKIGEIERVQEMELLQANRRPKTATEGEQWKSKYVTIEKKLQDERLKTTRLKKDLDKSIRIIHKEVGEFSTLDELLEKENWKGRAEQIKNLKNKVDDLKVVTQQSFNESNRSEQMYKLTQPPAFPKPGKKTDTVKESADARRKEFEDIKTQNLDLKISREKATEKFKAQKSRNKTLEDEIKSIRNDYDLNKQLLFEKSENDNRYIHALKTETQKLKKEMDSVKSHNANNEIFTRVVYRNQNQGDSQGNGQGQERSMINFSKDLTNGSNGGNHDEAGIRRELALRDNEISKKDKIVRELVGEKMKIEEELALVKGAEENKGGTRKLKAEIMATRLEKEDLIRMAGSGVGGVGNASKTIQDLSSENGKLRMKLMDLQSKLNKK